MSPAAEPRPDAVRVLPFRVRPLPDEPFDSWLETMAASFRSTISETACALGLIEQKHGLAVSATRWMANAWATALTDDQARRLESSTGILASQFQEMTRMRFARHAIRHTRSGRISARCPVGGMGGRYCPDCLTDSAGRWRMSWQFPFGFACPRHRRLLVDTCPGCGHPPRRVGHPLAVIPAPGRCHNPLGDSRGPTSHLCRTDLTIGADTVPASDAVLAAQRRMMRVVATGQAGFGIYADAPQPAVRVFEDIRLLSRAAHRAIETTDTLGILGLDRDLLPLLEGDGDGSAGIAAGNAAAMAALDDADLVTRLLRGRIARSTSYTQHTPQLQTLIAASLGRTRRPTAFLQSAPLTEQDPAVRARKVPAQMWEPWMRRFAPRRVGREVAATALSAALVFAGTRLTHSAALALIDPTAPVRQVTHVMRSLGSADQDADTLHALLRLAIHLDTHHVPIDYTRRRVLDYRELLPEERWTHICRAANVLPGSGRRWRTARAYLYRQLTGNPVRCLPLAGEDAAVTTDETDRFGQALPVPVRDELDSVGQEFLAAHGIREPLTWQPHHDDLTSAATPTPRDSPEWPTARPAVAAAQEVTPASEIAAMYAAGATTYELANRMNVSRQTVSRVLAETSTPTRRGRPRTLDIDDDRVRELYDVEGMTMKQIAETLGCSPSTVARRLRATRRPLASSTRGGSC